MVVTVFSQNWFKPIPGTAHHSINILSEVRNDKTGRILKQGLGCGGRYYTVSLCEGGNKKTYNVHTLMALAWGLEPSPGYVVDHVDNDPRNNHLDNLQVISYQQNTVKYYGWKQQAAIRALDRAYELTFKGVS